jgi:Domain of unknown function (DUF4145)
MAKNENEIIDPPDIQLQRLVEKTVDVAKKARRNRAPLSGLNFYADKLAKLKTDAVVYFQQLNDPSVGDISAMAEMVEGVFAAQTDYKQRVALSRNLLHELKTKKWRSIQTPLSPEEEGLFPLSLIAKTRRGYLTTICRQMNGCFSSGWYDAAAVMMRRLLETSIIEAFEAHRLDAKIKNAQGDFFQLSDLVGAALSETAWNLSRNTKKALPNLRDVGHISAHSRRYTAQRPDILKVSQDCRIAIEEFLHLAGLIT